MKTPFYQSKSPAVLINGKTILPKTPPPKPSSVFPICLRQYNQETPRINQSFSIGKEIPLRQRFSLEKPHNLSFRLPSPKKCQNFLPFNFPSTQQKCEPVKSLQQTRPQSVKSPQLYETTLFGTERNIHFDFVKDFNEQSSKFINKESLKPSSKPQFFNSIHRNSKNTSVNQNQLAKYLPINSFISSERKEIRMEGSFFIQNSFLFSTKDKEVQSYEVIDSPMHSKKSPFFEKKQRPSINETFQSNDQRLAIIKKETYQKSVEIAQKQSIKVENPIKQNKTSFDFEVPASPQRQQQQTFLQNQSKQQLNPIQTLLKKATTVKKINSLFNPMSSDEYESSSFDFSNSNLNNYDNNFQGYATQIKPKHKRRRYTVYSRHYSESESEIENHDFCTQLQSQLNKDHINRTNSSFSLDEADPLYQEQRSIMIKYLASMHKQRRREKQKHRSESSHGCERSSRQKKRDENGESGFFVEEECEIGNVESERRMAFVEFVNELEELEGQKYPVGGRGLVQLRDDVPSVFEHNGNQFTHFHASHHPHHQYHHHSHHSHHRHNDPSPLCLQTHPPYLSPFPQEPHPTNPPETPSQETPHIHHVINIGENPQQIKDNKMLIHVISIWLKEMGYLKEENRLCVVENIKRLFVDSFECVDRRVEESMLLENHDQVRQSFSEIDRGYHAYNSGNSKTSNNLLSKNHFNNPNGHANPPFMNVFHTQNSLLDRHPQNNYNSGFRNILLKHSFQQQQLQPHQQNPLTSRSTPNYSTPTQPRPPNRNQVSLQSTITSLYFNMYHKILPVQLQLLVLVNVCKRGWRFFEFFTVKVLKEIYKHGEKENGEKESRMNLENMLQRIVKNMVGE